MRTQLKWTAAIIMVAISLFIGAGCSDDSRPTGNNGPAPTGTTQWSSSENLYRSIVNGSSHTDFMYYSFTTKDTLTTGVPKEVTGTNWDIAFRRTEIKLNGGTSGSGSVLGMQMDSGMTIGTCTGSDSTGKSWVADAIDYAVDQWYSYNPVTHQLDMTKWVYSMVDAGGHNYAKFRIDSIVGAGMPPSMGTVWITYYYNPTADDKALNGATSTASINVGSGTGYFDFSSAAQVTPSSATSTDWDIAFSSYNCMLNSGPNGAGACAAFDAFTELTDKTDINGFTAQPSAPMFPDMASSVFSHGSTLWYNYNPSTHAISSKGFVYLIKSQGKLYKLTIEGYYANVGGTPASGYYTFTWNVIN
jgi:hypothetical protein